MALQIRTSPGPLLASLAGAVLAAGLACGGPTIPPVVPPPEPPTQPGDANPHHLEVNVINPFGNTADITSFASQGHHKVFGGDTSFDVVKQGGTGGASVYFDVQNHWGALNWAERVRGIVKEGGNDGTPSYACASQLFSEGGYKLKVEVQALYQGTWYSLGWVAYAHLENILVRNEQDLGDFALIADATYQYDRTDGSCSTNPHLHMELFNNKHYPCYIEDTPVAWNGSLGRIGGERGSVMACP